MLALDPAALDRVRVKIGFLFQSSALYDSMTVRENLEFPLRRHEIAEKGDDREALVKEALENVGLMNTMDMYPSELSGGMRRRIGLARTLILKPEIVLYDEPTTGLDPITSKEIVNRSWNCSRSTAPSAIISHDLNVAKLAANRIAVHAVATTPRYLHELHASKDLRCPPSSSSCNGQRTLSARSSCLGVVVPSPGSTCWPQRHLFTRTIAVEATFRR
jgi:ABC-type transporter Mla maintaining outer membrane lipid asymmetry ATPase subunit MlaF